MAGSRDVRMVGFATRTAVRDACAWIDARTTPLSATPMSLDAAVGRILAEEISSRISVPEFRRSAMDGYAVLGKDLQNASPLAPVCLKVIGEVLAGKGSPAEVGPGTAVRIMTGGPLPVGADVVVPVEQTRAVAAGVEISVNLPAGKNVSDVGEDVREGTTLLRRGRRLRPQDAAILAAIGVAEVPVIRAPEVTILTTGNELVEPGGARAPYQIYDANMAMLKSLVVRDGGHVKQARRLPDGRDVLGEALRTSEADVILISGGSSVGLEDHAPQLVRDLGDLAIHGLAMRPAAPAGLGTIGRALVFLLPGNPVSCLCAYDFFAGRAIRQLAGAQPGWPYARQQATLQTEIKSAAGRLDYLRVHLEFDQSRSALVARPVALGGASVLSSSVLADGFIVIPESQEIYPAGSLVTVYLYDPVPTSW